MNFPKNYSTKAMQGSGNYLFAHSQNLNQDVLDSFFDDFSQSLTFSCSPFNTFPLAMLEKEGTLNTFSFNEVSEEEYINVLGVMKGRTASTLA